MATQCIRRAVCVSLQQLQATTARKLSRVERTLLRRGNQSRRRLVRGLRATIDHRRRSGPCRTTTIRARSAADSGGMSTASIDHDWVVPGRLRREFQQRYSSCVVFGRRRWTTVCRHRVGNARSRSHIHRRSSGCPTSSRACWTTAGRVQSTAVMIRWTGADRGPRRPMMMKYSSTRKRRTLPRPINSYTATQPTRDVIDPQSTQC